jgi:diacylglycerol kinase family enzyme
MRGMGGRPSLDTGRLGVVSLVLGKEGGAAAFIAALATGHPERFKGFMTWSVPTFEVTSASPIELGLDGETMVMDPPLRFSMRPQPVRVRFARHAIGYSPAARSIGWRESLRDLWGVVMGRPSRFGG